MPRVARIALEKTCYHVITRGNQKQTVFACSQDYKQYLHTLARYKDRYRIKLYCFCLMPNHVHMLIETNTSSCLSKFMHGLNLSYTIYFNNTHKQVGHLWQDRFKSKIITKDAYLLSCISYIEANPVRANLVMRPQEYPWSSNALRNTQDKILDAIFD
jgi:putative transposase